MTLLNEDSDKKKMKVLYDFEAAEDNELSFKTGDIITILDDSDPNWWKGEGENGVGLFPSNFVTADLEEHSYVNGTTETELIEAAKLTNGLSEAVCVVNEKLLNETLHVLQSTDPETTTSDAAELIKNEETCLAMGTLIDDELKNLDKQHLELMLLNEKILESLRLYDKLMNQTAIYPPATVTGSTLYAARTNGQHVPTASSTYHPPAGVYTPAMNPNYQYSQPSFPSTVTGQSASQNHYHS